MKEKLARWLVDKYLPGFHLRKKPKTRKERPKAEDMQTVDTYMQWRKQTKIFPPDPKDFESPEEFQHEAEKWQMRAEATADERRGR